MSAPMPPQGWQAQPHAQPHPGFGAPQGAPNPAFAPGAMAPQQALPPGVMPPGALPVASYEWAIAKLHKHARAVILPALIIIAAAAFIGYSTKGLRDGGNWMLWAALAGIGAVVLGLIPIFAWLRNRVVITNIGTTRYTGMLKSTVQGIAHRDVVEVRTNRSGWQALFGSGNIILVARDQRRLELRDVPNAVTVAGALRELAGLPPAA